MKMIAPIAIQCRACILGKASSRRGDSLRKIPSRWISTSKATSTKKIVTSASTPPSSETTESVTESRHATRPPIPPYQIPKAFSIGAVAGVLGSLAGMGGAFVMIPLLTGPLMRVSQHAAHGTSLFAVAGTFDVRYSIH